MSLTILDSIIILAAQDAEGGDALLVAAVACLLAGPIFFIWKYLHYRNADKRHEHERDTKALIENVAAADDFVKHRKCLSNSEMNGRNDRRVDGSLLQGGIGSAISEITNKL